MALERGRRGAGFSYVIGERILMTSVTAANRTSLTVEGTQVSVLRGGSGTPLLFLHGSEAFGVRQPFMDELAARFDVIVPDHPGFGRSETPPWLDGIGDLAHFYRAFIAALGLHDVVLAGHDLGGWIACELALRDTRELRSLVLVDSAGLPLIEDGIDTFMSSPDELRSASYVDVRRAPDPGNPNQAKDALMTARVAWTPRFYDPQLAKWLHRLRLPALIVWGAQDKIFPVRQAEAFAAAISGAQTLVIPGAGHLPHVEQPHAFAAGVVAFAEGARP
jgi:pimeloyl-ACP methyl ester carboxylesterase